MRTDLQSNTPDIGDAIKTIIDSMLVELHTCLPAKIVKYYPATQYADVQIQLKRKYEDGTVKPISILPNVPVKWPRANGGKIRMHFPLFPGDDVTLVFAERSLDNWKTQGGLQDPNDRRKFNYSDAFALVGGSAEPDAFQVKTSDSIELINDQTEFIIKPNGKFQALNNTGEFVATLVNITNDTQQAVETLSTDTVNTMFGPTKLNAFATYAELASDLSDQLEVLESFKV